MTHAWQTGTVESDGERIYYEVTGAADAPAVVLGHGAGGSHASWFQQVPALASAGYRVITWDTRGFGCSSYVTGVHGVEASVRDLFRVLDATSTERAHLVGQSMGGWWVTNATLDSPARVQSLTLTNTIGGLWTPELREHTRQRAAAPEFNSGQLGVHSALARDFVERDPARAFLYQQINSFHTPPMADIWTSLPKPIEHAAIDTTGVPVFAITSSGDELFPAPLVVDSIKQLARAKVVEVVDAGHSTYFERPDEFNAVLLSFLASV